MAIFFYAPFSGVCKVREASAFSGEANALSIDVGSRAVLLQKLNFPLPISLRFRVSYLRIAPAGLIGFMSVPLLSIAVATAETHDNL
jgi:hypothetical protein